MAAVGPRSCAGAFGERLAESFLEGSVAAFLEQCVDCIVTGRPMATRVVYLGDVAG